MPTENRKQKTENRIIIAGGGTGGHLFPGIAVAQELRTRHQAEVIFLTTPKPVTARILSQYGIPWEAISSRALKGQGLFARLRAVAGLPGNIWAARSRLKALRPQLVLGIGGHTAGPVGVAAWSLGIPLAIHEQNTIPGFTNRLLSRLASRVFLSFPDRQGFFPPEKCAWTGNPIRPEFFQTPPDRPPVPFTVLIMGGSQGAHHLNMAVLAALPRLADLKEKLHFLQISGEADQAMVAAGFREAGFSAEVFAFTPEVAKFMARAHLLVCRAGASTLAELTAVGRTAILVPYPFAANNHQEFNARFLEEVGAAEVILNKDFTGEVLAGKIREIFAAPQWLTAREAASRSLACPAAAREIAQGCLDLIGTRE